MEQGCSIHLFSLYLPSVELALARIAERVRLGGHDVPEEVVRRRFNKGLHNLFHYYRPMLDSWSIFDNSADVPRLIAQEESEVLRIVDCNLYTVLSEEANLT